MYERIPDDIADRLAGRLSADFLEAYDLLFEAVFFGVGPRDDVHIRHTEAHEYEIKDLGLWELKKEVDGALRRVASALQRREVSRGRRRP